MTSPYHKCPDRTRTCHDTCEKYRDWRDRMRAAKDAIRKDIEIGAVLNKSKEGAKKRVAKGGGKKWTNL